jgi:hypothetical protein
MLQANSVVRRAAALGFVCLLTLSCGPTVGDACALNSDCGQGSCITKDYAPGGTCSRACQLDDIASCPSGSICVKNALGRDQAGCLRRCETALDCRRGYVCRIEKDSVQPVCIGPTGI